LGHARGAACMRRLVATDKIRSVATILIGHHLSLTRASGSKYRNVPPDARLPRFSTTTADANSPCGAGGAAPVKCRVRRPTHALKAFALMRVKAIDVKEVGSAGREVRRGEGG
jgi:hypothetical protein